MHLTRAATSILGFRRSPRRAGQVSWVVHPSACRLVRRCFGPPRATDLDLATSGEGTEAMLARFGFLFIISAVGARGIPHPEEPVERARAWGRVFLVAVRRLEWPRLPLPIPPKKGRHGHHPPS